MPNSAQLETFAAGVETAVDVPAIERQLRELWQLAAESEKDPSRRQITRACLFNLVVYCETNAARDRATEVISTLTSRHPCRAIVLLAQADEPQSELGASITAHCHLTGAEHKQVCCEQISIHASGASVVHLAAAVLPLLESDLPTVLWWNGVFLDRPELFRRLSGVSDRVLFDTSTWPKQETRLNSLVRVMSETPRTSFADLSWTRLGLWRRLTAECFDEPHCLEALPQIRRVEVTHGCGPGARLRALLYASWVAAQLGWPADDAAKRIGLKAREDTDATSVGILSIALKGNGVEVCVRKNYGERAASATVSVPNACGLPHKRAFWPTDDASLLSQELDHSAPHRVYERALTMAAELVGARIS
jgi:glucose-6-phosphate dehydrogenase assembly protein OpcA